MSGSLKTPVTLEREGVVVEPGPGERATFNPAAAADASGNIHLLFRVIQAHGRYASRLGHSVSSDGGKTFQRLPDPVIYYDPSLGAKLIQTLQLWVWHSLEDPRLSQINGTWYLTIVVLKLPPFSPGQQAVTLVAETDDRFERIKVLGIVTPQELLQTGDCRNTALVPTLIDGKFWLLHRPQSLLPPGHGTAFDYTEYGSSRPTPASCWISAGQNLLDMPAGQVLMRVQNQPWEQRGVHVGPPPIQTAAGWLLLYITVAQAKYRVGAALLDLHNPAKVIARLPYYLLEPVEPYEVHGDVCDNVVFPGGSIVQGDKLVVFYGGGDRVCARASCSLSQLLVELARHPV